MSRRGVDEGGTGCKLGLPMQFPKTSCVAAAPPVMKLGEAALFSFTVAVLDEFTLGQEQLAA